MSSLFSLTALFLTIYLSQFSLTLSIFLFSFVCSHSCSSSRLHQSSQFGTSLLFFTSSNVRMASPFISSSFPSFLPFTLFTSSHNICKPVEVGRVWLELPRPIHYSKPNTSSIRKPNSTRIIIPSTSRPTYIYIYIYILGL